MGSSIFTIGFQSFCITEVETFISYVNFHVSEVFGQDVILLQVRIQFSYLDIKPCTTIISPGTARDSVFCIIIFLVGFLANLCLFYWFVVPFLLSFWIYWQVKQFHKRMKTSFLSSQYKLFTWWWDLCKILSTCVLVVRTNLKWRVGSVIQEIWGK